MAQFTVQGRWKLLFNSDGVHYRLVSNKGQRSFEEKNGGLGFVGYNNISVKSPFLRKKPSMQQVYAGVRLSNTTPEGSIDDDHDDDYEDLESGSDYDSDFEEDDLSCFRGLVLDITYRPINIVCWKRAICLEFLEKADVLEYYDQTVNSPSGSFNIPAVLRIPQLVQVVKRTRIKRCISRKNILHRDGYTCQYCSSRENLTIDHILPSARGGEWKWENLVTACSKCNSKKGHKTLEEANMTLLKVPKAPKEFEVLAIPLASSTLLMLARNGTPEEWRQYLPL